MIIRSLLVAAALLIAGARAGYAAETTAGEPAIPVLRAAVTVNSDVVRIGDFVDNAGAAAAIAIFRAPDAGTTGVVPVEQVVAALRAHQVIGVDVRDIAEITVTRAARTLGAKDIERQVAQALVRQSGFGDAADLAVTFDRPAPTMNLDPSYSGELQPIHVRYDRRSGRFEVVFELGNEAGAPMRLRFGGSAVETVETAILTRSIERGEIVRASDVSLQRRPRSEAGTDLATRTGAIGMAARRALRANQALKLADLAKPDLVQRDQTVTLIYDMPGLRLTIMGKATENGAEGDIVTVMNLQSKRTVQGIVSGAGRVTVSTSTPTNTAQLSPETAADGRSAE